MLDPLDILTNIEDVIPYYQPIFSAEEQKAFEPYYGETYLSEETDYHKLYDLMDNLYEFELFTEEYIVKS